MARSYEPIGDNPVIDNEPHESVKLSESVKLHEFEESFSLTDFFSPADDALAALNHIVNQLPKGGEVREGQRYMTQLIAEALENKEHLIVQAGTGTGKSLAYLVPVILSGERTVIATATKALQDQLAEKDLPFVAEHLDMDINFTVLKGRSNYLCRQRLDEATKHSTLPIGLSMQSLDFLADDQNDQANYPDNTPETLNTADFGWLDNKTLDAIIDFSSKTATGDRSDLDIPVSNNAWRSLSVTRNECPGAMRCPYGQSCFAEKAKAKAATADIVIVNLHLYALSILFSGILSDHSTVVIDEAHELEEIFSSSISQWISPRRFSVLARSARSLKISKKSCDALDTTASSLTAHLTPLTGRRIAIPSDVDHTADSEHMPNTESAESHTRKELIGQDLYAVLDAATIRVSDLGKELKEKLDNASEDEKPALQRLGRTIQSITDDLYNARNPQNNDIMWVDGQETTPALRITPLRIDKLLADSLWSERTAVLTSATIPPALKERTGLPEDTTLKSVESPFDYRRNALLYCPRTLPLSGRRTGLDERFDELETLMGAAQGRTLALYTNYSAMNAAANAMQARLPWPILVQGSQSKASLLKKFASDEHSSLFATISFWQGVDVPGSSCSLVVIDKLPFPRPDDPVLQARRELAGANAFRVIDLSHTATLLTQGVGRLIRKSDDRGVVAVLDSRLATRQYRHTLLQNMPPMRRTVNRSHVIEFLRAVTSGN